MQTPNSHETSPTLQELADVVETVTDKNLRRPLTAIEEEVHKDYMHAVAQKAVEDGERITRLEAITGHLALRVTELEQINQTIHRVLDGSLYEAPDYK